LRRVSDLVVAERPRRVLEVGCGEGVVLAHLAARLPGTRFDGLEVDETALARARSRCPDVVLVRGDACELPFRSRSFDLVLCLEVLEHLPEPARALRELRRVAGVGCLVSVPHEPFFRLGNALRGKNLRRLGNPSDHVQHWGARDFAAFCGRELSVRVRASAFPWLIVYGAV
jgi:SAM-dependent methyltransferase